MTTAATESLARADALTAKARQSARWYGRYLLAFAAGSFVFCLTFGVIPVQTAAITVTPFYLLFIALLTVYALRRKTAMRGMGNVHAVVMGSWTVLWGNTITFGVLRFQDWLPWWILGGIALALPGIIGALVVFRRLRA